MDVQVLKEKIIEENTIEHILDELGCHHIRDRGKFYSAARPEGDNTNSVIVYKDTLVSNCYTKGIENVDIISLVEHLQDLYFVQAMNWICQICGWDYYERPYVAKKDKNDLEEVLGWLDEVERLKSNLQEEDVNITPIPNTILNQYLILPNTTFYNEGISLSVQKEFEVGFDYQSKCITIPIRDELGTLVGVKGRSTISSEINDRYIYLYPAPKTKILYGFYKSLPYIKQQKKVIIVEGEKTVQKLWGWGYKNCVAINGKVIHKRHEDLLFNELKQSEVILALDKDVERKKIKEEIDKIKLYFKTSVIYDKWNLLSEKDSPADQGKDVFEQLYKNRFIISS